MPLVRCPQCGRVADGRNCFACGYEWPRGAAAAPAPTPTPAPAPPPRAPTPQPPPANPFGQAPSSTPFPAPPGPSPFAQKPASNPFSQPPAPSPFAPQPTPAPSPFAPKPGGSNPLFSAPPPPAQSSPFAPVGQTSPFAQSSPPMQSPPSFSMAPPSDFAMPPPPDEIVVDTDLSFSLAPNAINPTIGSGRMPTPAPQPGAEGRSGLDSLFDGVDLALPRAAPTPMSDPALDAGDFLPKATPPPPPPQTNGGGLDDWGPGVGDGSNGAAADGGLGADLLAAFNASAEPSLDDAGDISLGLDISIATDADGADGLPADASLDARLRNLAERLRADGRGDDAEIVTEALLALELR